MMVRAVTKLRERRAKETEEPAVVETEDVLLLRKIRDLLKTRAL